LLPYQIDQIPLIDAARRASLCKGGEAVLEKNDEAHAFEKICDRSFDYRRCGTVHRWLV
jgi:hypothetical protein